MCGAQFTRVLNGTVKTDVELAESIQKLKNPPQAPAVSAASGYAPQQEPWLDYMRQLANWLAATDQALAASIRAIEKDPEVAHENLEAPRRCARSLALGNVLRGADGIGEMTNIISSGPLEAGCGLWILQEASNTVLEAIDDVQFVRWQKPDPISQAHLVKAGILKWEKLRVKLAAKGRLVVNDEMIAMQAFETLVGSCPEVKLIVGHLQKTYGSGLKLDQIKERKSCTGLREVARGKGLGGDEPQRVRCGSPRRTGDSGRESSQTSWPWRFHRADANGFCCCVRWQRWQGTFWTARPLREAPVREGRLRPSRMPLPACPRAEGQICRCQGTGWDQGLCLLR
jgi:hypothetical protein